jgi:hypothetical protein
LKTAPSYSNELKGTAMEDKNGQNLRLKFRVPITDRSSLAPLGGCMAKAAGTFTHVNPFTVYVDTQKVNTR